MNFEIVVDSCFNLGNAYAEKHNLNVLSLAYIVDGEEYAGYTKGQDLDYAAFYGRLREKAPASTAQITSVQADEMCRPILESGKDVLYIGFSSGLSGTFAAVRTALEELKTEFPDRKIYYVDTLTVTVGLGIMTECAVNMRDEGKTIEEVHTWLEDNKQKVLHFFTVDDLFHLKRGGRLSATKALMGTALNVKPTLMVNPEGKLSPVGKAKGRKKALDTVAEAAQYADANLFGKIFVVHGDVAEDAEYVAKAVRAAHPAFTVETFQLDPVIGVHAGPGVIAVVMMSSTKQRDS
ncbi:MAG: DegV family protein [Defluviitaleaceae bacterium]|nr:DegV family protein [Defluviitaleaceae bacterium]